MEFNSSSGLIFYFSSVFEDSSSPSEKTTSLVYETSFVFKTFYFFFIFEDSNEIEEEDLCFIDKESLEVFLGSLSSIVLPFSTVSVLVAFLVLFLSLVT